MDWELYRKAFESDDTLRDIYIRNAGTIDWQNLIALFNQRSLNVKFFKGNKEISLTPDLIKDYFETNEYSDLHLTLHINGIQINSHLFSGDEIELYLDPRDITGEARFQKLFNFLTEMAAKLNKEVILTYENGIEQPILKFKPAGGDMKHIPATQSKLQK